jgi:pyruvate/2-oxoglutarate/acetoin dehydrogenase E1 component
MQLTYLEAIRQGIWEEMERDSSVFCIGEDIGIYGGAFKVTDGFIDHFGPERVIDTPIAESAIFSSWIFCRAHLTRSSTCAPRRIIAGAHRCPW